MVRGKWDVHYWIGRKAGVDISPQPLMDGLCIAWELRKDFESVR